MYPLVPYPPLLLSEQLPLIIAGAFFAVLGILRARKPRTLQIRLLRQPVGVVLLRIRGRAGGGGGIEGGAFDEAPPPARLDEAAANVIPVARGRRRYRSSLALGIVDGGAQMSSDERWRQPWECGVVVFILSPRVDPS